LADPLSHCRNELQVVVAVFRFEQAAQPVAFVRDVEKWVVVMNAGQGRRQLRTFPEERKQRRQCPAAGAAGSQTGSEEAPFAAADLAGEIGRGTQGDECVTCL